MSSLAVYYCLALLMIAFSDAYLIHYSEERYNSTEPQDKEGHIGCMCDGQNISEALPKNSLEKIFQSIRSLQFCSESFVNPICGFFKDCETCKAEIKKCYATNKEAKQYECSVKQFVMVGNTIPGSSSSSVVSINKTRVARQVQTCVYPTNLKTADLICTKYPNSIKCRQKCIFGHTLKEGIVRHMRCNYTESKWYPIGFEECQPFVDCTMSLVSTGKLDCISGTTRAAPSCNVSCEKYEDKSRTPLRTYECRISGAWSMKLPFCVLPGTGLDLAPAPRIKLHQLKGENYK